MPWMWIFILIGGAYVLIKLVQGIIELVRWWRENRETAELQRQWKAKRRKESGKN
jgi:hypothetical protein